MKPRHIDSITLKNILLNIKHSFGLTYTKMAQELDVSTKTLNRWKDGNKTYKTLKKEDYKTLFTLLEQKGACERDSDFVKMLQKWYSELLPYKTKADIKKVIQMSLDYHLNPIPLDEENNSSSIIVHAKEYILSCLNNEKNIDNICMAFHSGWDWLKENEKNQLIELINERGITLRVIVNHRDAIRKIAKTMCDPKMAKHYLGFNEGIKKWNDLAIDLENFEFRISDYPIFRKIYIINYKDGTSEARMRDYVYDYATEYDEVAIHLTHNDSSLHIFQQEFVLFFCP